MLQETREQVNGLANQLLTLVYHCHSLLNPYLLVISLHTKKSVYTLARCFQNQPAFKFEGDKAELIEKIRQALYFSKIISYAQGFAQLRVASKENNWNLPFADIASIWRDGCIIRSRFLQKITDAYNRDADLAKPSLG